MQDPWFHWKNIIKWRDMEFWWRRCSRWMQWWRWCAAHLADIAHPGTLCPAFCKEANLARGTWSPNHHSGTFFIRYIERGESVREMRREVSRGESIKRGEKRCENGRIWQRLSHKTLEYSTNLHLTTGKRGFFWSFNKGIPALRNHIISTPIWEQEGDEYWFLITIVTKGIYTSPS